jgi:hypothetical protein
MNAAISFSVRPDVSGGHPENVLGRSDGLADMADLRRGLALPERGDDPLGGLEPAGHPDLFEKAMQGQVHAVRQPVAGFARLGIIDGDPAGIDLLQVLLEGLPDAGDETDDRVPGPRILDHLLVVEADDGPRLPVPPDDERRVPGEVGRDEEGQDGVAVDRALAGERDPAIDAEFPEQARGLRDLLADEGHIGTPFGTPVS